MTALKNITGVLKALADENRIRIIHLLNEKKDLCVCEIREIIGLSQPTVSSHLKLLENSGLVDYSKEGKWVNYRMGTDMNAQIKKILYGIFSAIEADKGIKNDGLKLYGIDRKKICRS